MNVFIFTGPVRSGKTNALRQWCRDKKSVTGVLTPDIDGIRKMFLLPSETWIPFECKNINTVEELITVGRFHFYNSAFVDASLEIAINADHSQWIVIDEIGPLELRGGGFHSLLSSLLKKESDANLLLVVRNSLVAQTISFFGLSNPQVLSELPLPTGK